MAIRRQHIRNSRAVLEAGTPLVAEYPFDTTLKAIRAGDGATLGGFLQKRWRYSYPVSPAQITADQNDYSPADLNIAETLLLTSDAARSITGLAGGTDGANLKIVNRGGFDITLVSASAASLAANRFLFESDVVLRPRGAIELQYSVTDGRWMRTNGGTKFAAIPQELLLTGAITPAQITADTNNYAPANITLAQTLRLSTDTSRALTGLVDPREGSVKTILNAGNNPLVLKSADPGSAAANRFDFGGDITLAGKQSATLRYDGADQRWKLLAQTAGSAIAAGAVTAQTLSAAALGMSMINGTLVTSVAGSALTIAIKTLAGADPSAADPVWVLVRNTTPGACDYTAMQIAAATSIVVSSGSSLGVVANATAFKIWVVGFNDGGVIRLGVMNCLNGSDVYPLSAWGIGSAAAEGGAGGADNAHVFYSALVIFSKPYATLGYLAWETGLAATSIWSATPSRAQLLSIGVALPGTVVQEALGTFGSVATGTTSIPLDDTVPQNTEGDQYVVKSITPTSASSLLRVRARLPVSANGTQFAVAALFQDSLVNALAAADIAIPSAGYTALLTLEADVLANLTSATTFKLRAGLGGAATMTVNGSAGTRRYNGAQVARLHIAEIAT